MTILQPHSQEGWITAIICGRWVQAKVYNEPSTYGIATDGRRNYGRVSKLAISKTDSRDPNKNFFDQMDVNYDRGSDFNNLWRKNRKLYFAIVRELEALPLLDLSHLPEYAR